ncbi:MAG: HK97 family phage prohead protease [Bacteroidales bacterium]|nr:HK97 family phage prohead protease [Bacteroidales bacterium]
MRFILCDSETVNSYGFRTEVKGIDLTRFEKNPVMLYNHNPEKVIGRWEDVQVIDTLTGHTILTASPVFDKDDPFAAEIARKVEQGFIKGCSMGIVIKNITQTKGIDTATNSVLIEASIVTIPADENALVVYDDEEKQNKLSINEFNKLFYKMEAEENNKPIDNSQLTIDNLQAELAAKDDIITDLSAQVDELKKDLAERDYHEAETAIDTFIGKGAIKKEVKSEALAFYLQNPEAATSLFESLTPAEEPKPAVTLSAMIQQQQGTPTWNELDREGKLAELKANNYPEFCRLFFERFGREYDA